MTVKKIIHANNIDYLRKLKDNSVDSVVTDPPYGINFMNKHWDYDVPTVELWKECLRVLKPGGHMLVACGTRTQHRMAVNIEDAGFEIRDIVAWVYGSGFPKSHDISKAIDKMMGAEREVVGKSDSGLHRGSGTTVAYGIGNDRTQIDITAPSTEQAKQWEGWGTALKPSMELWTLARKPLTGTVAQNILEYGVGGLNIDGCRVEAKDGDVFGGGGLNSPVNGFMGNTENTYKKGSGFRDDSAKGRFPANFIHDGSDEVEALFPDTKSGKMTSEHQRHTDGSPNGIYGKFDENHPLSETYGDSGSASRFFYVAKASQEERNFGLSFMESKTTTDGRKKPIDNAFNRGETKRKNIHPTVKPIDLMRYLVRMITPPNGICLDPYLGSGTTAIACEMEKFNYIGIELDEQYVEIAKARVDAVKDYETTLDTKTAIKESIKEDKEKELGIQNIFDFLEGVRK